MNTVERVKAICKERKIPVYKLEKDLGFSNGYISQLKKGSLPEKAHAPFAVESENGVFMRVFIV